MMHSRPLDWLVDSVSMHIVAMLPAHCAVLGPEEGNKQLRRHWASWVREEDVRAIAQSGATVVRIPVGDWMYVPYEPYIGCTDGESAAGPGRRRARQSESAR